MTARDLINFPGFAEVLKGATPITHFEPEMSPSGFSSVFKYNPYRDKHGQFTVKEKAGYQKTVAENLVMSLEKGIGANPDHLSTALGKSQITDLATAYHKAGKHGVNAGVEGNDKIPSLDKFIQANAVYTNTGDAIFDAAKGPVAAKKAWLKIYQNKSIAGIEKDLPDLLKKLDDPNATTTEYNKAFMAYNKKVEFLSNQFLENHGDPELLKATIKQAHSDHENNSNKTAPSTVTPGLSPTTSGTQSTQTPQASTTHTFPPTPKFENLGHEMVTMEWKKMINEGEPEKFKKSIGALVVSVKNNAALSNDPDTIALLKYGHSLVKGGAIDSLLTVPKKGVPTQVTGKPKDSAENDHATKFTAPPSKTDATFEYHALGMEYYKKQEKFGKDSPEAKAAYENWKPAKEHLSKIAPELSQGTLSSNAKSAAKTAITQAEKDKVTLKENNTSAVHSAAYDMAHAKATHGVDSEQYGQAKNHFTKAVDKAQSEGLTADDTKKTIVEAQTKQKTDAKEAKKFAAVMKDHKTVLALYDDKTSFKNLENDSGLGTYMEHHKKQVASLSSDEKNAISNYTGFGYKGQNKAMVSGSGHTDANTVAKALAKTTLGENVKLRRNMAQKWFWKALGVSETDMNSQTEAALKKHIGKTYTETAFSSTSKDLNFGGAFSNTASKSGAVILNIRAHKGIRGLDVGAISNHANEKEVILDKGVTYVIRSVQKLGKTPKYRYSVDVDAIGHKG